MSKKKKKLYKNNTDCENFKISSTRSASVTAENDRKILTFSSCKSVVRYNCNDKIYHVKIIENCTRCFIMITSLVYSLHPYMNNDDVQCFFFRPKGMLRPNPSNRKCSATTQKTLLIVSHDAVTLLSICIHTIKIWLILAYLQIEKSNFISSFLCIKLYFIDAAVPKPVTSKFHKLPQIQFKGSHDCHK